MHHDPPTVQILGSRVHLISLADALAAVEERILSGDGRCHQIIVTGFHGLWLAHRDPSFGAILNSADLWLPDGIAPILVARCHGHKGLRRIPGAELLAGFCELADRKGYRSFFYGDTEQTLEALRTSLHRLYPGHRVVGAFSPPFRPPTECEDEEHIRMINDARPDVLWVGLGLPKQDRWIHQRLHRLRVPVAIGVGAAIGFMAGQVKRAPAWIGNLGFEWAYRLACEPRKCWRRCFVEGPQFISHVLMELSGIRKYARPALREIHPQPAPELVHQG